MSDRVQSIFLVGLCACTLGVTLVVAGQHWKIGIADEWQWEYFKKPAPWIVACMTILVGVVLAGVIGLSLQRRLSRPFYEILAVGACMILSLGIILDLADAGPLGGYETLPVTASPWIGGYYGEAVRIEDMGPYLEYYPERISRLRVNEPYGHLADHPVGPVLFHWLVNKTLEAWPALAARFVPSTPEDSAEARSAAERFVGHLITDGAFAGIRASALLFRLGYWLSLIPVYLLGRMLYSREAGLVGLALAALIPSLHLFGPYPDQLFPLLAVIAFYAWLRALNGLSVTWAAVSAVALLVGLLWSLAFLAIAALLGAAALLRAWREIALPTPGDAGSSASKNCASARLRWREFAWADWALVCLTWVGVFLLGSLLPGVFLGYDVWGVWRICLSQHASFAELFPRSYVWWTLFNPVEFALFTGVPAFLLMALGAVADVRRWWRERWRFALPVLPWALLAVLAALNFSGKNLAEVSRLWMFLMPFAAVAAGHALEKLDARRGWVAGCVLLTAMIQLVTFRLSLDVMGVLVMVNAT